MRDLHLQMTTHGNGISLLHKARTRKPNFTGFSKELAVDLANSTAESADSTTHSVIVGQLDLSNMFNILNPLELADGNRPTIAVGRQKIGQVGTDLKSSRSVIQGKILC